MKKYSIILLFCILSLVSIGCSEEDKSVYKIKHECDFCGEERKCKEKDLFGEIIYVCEDCSDELRGESDTDDDGEFFFGLTNLDRDYTSAIDNFLDFSIKGDIEALEKLAPADFWQELEDEYDVKVNDIKDDLKNMVKSQVEELEEDYGKNIRVYYDVIDEYEMDEYDLDDIKDTLKDNYGIASKSVNKGFEVEIEATIKGSEDEDTNEIDLTLVQIGGNWYYIDIFSQIKYYAY